MIPRSPEQIAATSDAIDALTVIALLWIVCKAIAWAWEWQAERRKESR